LGWSGWAALSVIPPHACCGACLLTISTFFSSVVKGNGPKVHSGEQGSSLRLLLILTPLWAGALSPGIASCGWSARTGQCALVDCGPVFPRKVTDVASPTIPPHGLALRSSARAPGPAHTTSLRPTAAGPGRPDCAQHVYRHQSRRQRPWFS